MNLTEYNRATGTKNTDEKRVLKARFPKYDRATHSMVTHPEDYGVELTDEAQNLLIAVFGPGPGLGENPRRTRRTRTENRRCNNRYYFRLDDKTAAGFKLLLSQSGYTTVQDFMANLISSLVEASAE